MATKKIRVVKVPLSAEAKNRDYPKAFPKMPILYLELFENKARIKPELVNKEYVPKISLSNEMDETIKEDYFSDEEHKSQTLSSSDSEAEPEPTRDSRSEQPKESRSGEQPRSSERIFSDSEKEDNEDGNTSDYHSSSQKENPNHSPSSLSSSSSPPQSKGKKIQDRLKELLGDSDEESEHDTRGKDRRDDRERRKYDSAPAPSLGDLEKSGKFQRKREMEDVGHISMNDQEKEDAKHELLFKFELLKKSYKTNNIPEFTIHSDYETMRKSYESTLRTLSLDKSVEDYKKYLIGGFMLMEFVCGNWLGFDMQGFTQQQIISMSSYERLLIELGEKSYVPSGSNWSVEVRLLFLIVMNAAFFIISKMIMKKTGSNLMGMINNMNASSTSSTQSSSASAEPLKRRMRGPNVRVDDIPDLNETTTQTSS
jgi:hypothetical protein